MVNLKYPESISDQTSLIVHFLAHKMATKDVISYSMTRALNTGTEIVNGSSNLDTIGEISLALPSSTLTESFSSNWDIGNMASKAADSSIGQFAQMALGVVIPPVYKAIYKDSSPRTYNFNFSFLPKNSDETNKIKEIILNFKSWAAAGALFDRDGGESGMDMCIPYIIEFHFEQGSSKLDELVKPQYCIIENISVNYFDNGQITAYSDGMPKSTSLSLSLKEITVPLRSDFVDEKR